MDDPKPVGPDQETPQAKTPVGEDRTASGFSFDARATQDRLSPRISSFVKGELLAGRFRIVRFVARGGMGEVYEAEDTELNERVALKTVRFEFAEEDRSAERFKREIQLARKVTHLNVCRTFDVFRHIDTHPDGRTTETMFVSMELLAGETLRDRIRRGGKMTESEALPLVEQMAAGLDAAHRVGVVHRDFKSSNVILVPSEHSPGGVRAVITDFGLAHGLVPSGLSLTGTQEVVGTPAYMAPEQLNGGTITPATDIYALGVVMFEMLTGAVPFNADNPLSTALKRLSEPAPSPRVHVPSVDPGWESGILRCLEREPSERFARTDELIKVLKGDEVLLPKRRARKGSANEKKRIYLAAGAAIVLVLCALGYAGYKHDFWRAQQTSKLTPAAEKARTSVAILGFQNLSGQESANVLGEMLADSLWSQLDTDQIRFIQPSRVDEMRQSLGIRDISESLNKQQVEKIAKYLGSDVLVTGSYRVTGAPDHSIVDWNIHLIRTTDDESVGSIQATGKESELNSMAVRAGKLVRARLGVELSASEESRMDSAFSTNSDALKYFSEARERLRNFEVLAATKLLEKSISADPDFAQAHSLLAEGWSDLGYDSKAEAEAKRAFDLTGKMSTESRGIISGRYFEMSRDWNKAIEQYSSLWTLFNDDPEYGLLLARAQIGAGKASAALTTLSQLSGRELPLGPQAQMDLLRAEAQQFLANYREQLSAANSAAEKAKSLGSNLLLARARVFQCWATMYLGSPADAKPLCEEASKLNTQSGDQLGIARATNQIANAYYSQGDTGAARPLYEQAAAIAQTIGDKLDEAGALTNIANIKNDQGDLVGARKAYENSIEAARDRGDKSGQALAQQNLAIVLYKLGDSRRGEGLFEESIKLAHDIADKRTESLALNNLCMVSLQSGALDRALKSCEGSLRMRSEMNDAGREARSQSSLGDVQVAQGNLSGAQQSYQDALKTQQSLEQKGDAAYSQISLAALALEEKKPEDAKKLAQEAVTELASEKDVGGEAQGRGTLALALLNLGDMAGAGTQIEQATTLAQQANDRNLKLMIAIAKARIDAASGKTEEAVKGLASVEKEARAAGLVAIEFEARLALGEIERKAGQTAKARATLTALAQEAKAKGFNLIAAKAGGASK
jgi:tetratricopeptide (TPR) repeat protein/tRNA A-37 threonylcarbamoyl transferase component Bud32/TolB-like protein